MIPILLGVRVIFLSKCLAQTLSISVCSIWDPVFLRHFAFQKLAKCVLTFLIITRDNAIDYKTMQQSDCSQLHTPQRRHLVSISIFAYNWMVRFE